MLGLRLGLVLTVVYVVLLNVPRLASAADAETENRLAEIEERLDRAEKKTVLDRISLSGEYRTTLSTFVYRGPSPNPYDLTDPTNPLTVRHIEDTAAEVWSHRFRLGLKAEPITSLRFTARLVMFHHFGDGDAPPFVQDSMAGRLPRDTAMRFDQLWIDWFMFDWVALSAGRIAYAEGNPNELRENSTVRRATWGLQMVDGEYETINLTFNLKSLVEGWYARLFYASWFNDNDADPLGGLPFLSNGTDNLRIFGGNVDLVVPGIGKNFIQMGYYYVPRFRPFVVPIPDPGFNPASDYTHAPAVMNGSLLFPSKMPSSLGTYQNASALVEFYNFLNLGIDWFASAAVGFLDPNGKGIEYELPVPGIDPNNPVRKSTPFLFLASEGDDGLTFFFYGGLRYTFPFATQPKIGFEYNYGSRYLISFATPTDQLLTKLGTRGSAYEAYVIVPINKYIYLRGSYLFVSSNYQEGFFGPNPAIAGSTAPARDQKIHNIQFLLNASL